MYKRKLAVLFTVLLVSIMMMAFATPAVAYSEYPLRPDDVEIDSALDYLRGIQAADGSIGSYSDSAWAIMAISAAGEHPERWQVGGVSVVDYLRNNASLLSGEFNLGTAYGRVVLAIIAAGENPSAFGTGDPTYAPGGDYLSMLKGLHNGIQFTDGFGAEDLLNDDFWGLIAIIAAREPASSSLVTTTKTFIKNNQAEDGGWCWGTAGNPWYDGSDVDDSAAAIMALMAAGENPGSVTISDGFSYLSSEQNISGGFIAYGAPNLGSTNWAVSAMKSAMQNPESSHWTPGTVNPVAYILGFQEAEGSFYDPGAWTPAREKNTANSIVALVGKSYPVRYYPIVSVGGSAYSIGRISVLLPWVAILIALTAALFMALRHHAFQR